MGRANLVSKDLNAIDWKPDHMGAALDQVQQFVIGKAQDAEHWYWDAIRKVRVMARLFRVGAILLTALAGLLPMINEVHRTWRLESSPQTAPAVTETETSLAAETNGNAVPNWQTLLGGRPWFSPVWSAILLGLAATLLALDRFYGTTAGWIRYVLTVRRLVETLDDFRFVCESQRISWNGQEPNSAQVLQALKTSQNFLREVNAIVTEETKTWAENFSAVVKQLDEQMKQVSKSQEESAIQLAVTNGHECASGWKLCLGSNLPETRFGSEASIEARPGLHVVRVVGQIDGKTVQAEQAVKLAPGEIQRIEMTLA